MTDYTELKRLAEAASSDPLDCIYQADQVLGHFSAAASPSAVLALIAENERLTTQVRLAGVSAEVTVHQEVGRAITETLAVTIERDQLKAENEALRNSLKGLIHASDATGWEQHTCGEIAKARELLGQGEQS